MKWLSKCYDELPSHCIFNKVRTGCGGTTLEINNKNRNSIIAVPFINLIRNKMDVSEGVQGVFSDIKNEEIMDYLERNKIHKIMCTWDSLPRVMDILFMAYHREVIPNEPKDYFLLVDEVHCLTIQYEYRKEAIDRVLKCYRGFANWCFMTATPIGKEFVPEELKEVEIIRAGEMDDSRPHVDVKKTYHLAEDVAALVRDYLDHKETNAHIFVNSVEFIATIVSNIPELNMENCKAVWSDNNPYYFESIEGRIYRDAPHRMPKKINFYTSTCFEGCDIWDKNGETIVVADGYKDHTLNDIPTTFVQIAGRIRNSLYSQQNIRLYFTPSNHSDHMTYEEYEVFMHKKERTLRLYTECVNRLHGDPEYNTDIECLFEELNWNHFKKDIDGCLEVDLNSLKIDLLNYKNSHWTYADYENLCFELAEAGMETDYHAPDFSNAAKLKRNPRAKVKFEDTMKEVIELNKFVFTTSNEREQKLRVLYGKYPEMKEFYDQLGPEKIIELHCNKRNLNNELIKRSDAPLKHQIAEMLAAMGIKENTVISLKDLKKTLQDIYDELGYRQTAVATDIDEYYRIKETKTSDRENGFIIGGKKAIYGS